MGLIQTYIKTCIFIVLFQKAAQRAIMEVPSYPYVKDIDFYSDYKRTNNEFLSQIYKNQVYCDLNIIFSQSYINRFENIQEAINFVELALQLVNSIFERQLSWEKNLPMVVYVIKSVHQLTKNNSLTQNIDQPEKLLRILNQIDSFNEQHYCQNVLLTAEDWGDILGVAYQDLVNKRIAINLIYNLLSCFLAQGNLCETPSSIVLTAMMKRHFVNHATLAYLMAHEMAHTLCADHDVLTAKDSSRKFGKIINRIHFKNPFLLIKGGGDSLIMKHYIMDAGTGMIPEYFMPEFSDESVNVIAQCLFVKGVNCFKNRIFSVCGNGVTESGEQCDTGDHCCHPPGTALECTFVDGAVCSTDEPCCSDSCQFKKSNVICHPADQCSSDSYCSGKNGTCQLNYLPDKEHSECNNGRALCSKGKCNASLCLKFNQESCNTSEDDSCLIKCYNVTSKRCEAVRSIRTSKPLYIPNGWKCGITRHGVCNDGVCRSTSTHSFFSDDASYKYVSITFVSLTLVAILATLYIGYTVHKLSKNHYYSSLREIQQ